MKNFTVKGLFTLLLAFAALSIFAQQPSNHPTAFTATTQSGTSIKLDWTGSTGANLPSNYLIYYRIVPAGTFPTPADGTAVPDDTDLSDNLGAKNVAHAVGANTVTISGLLIDTDYEFIIYPYKTGGAPDPDFKTNGSPATATASTKRPTVTSPTVSNINNTTATMGGTVTSNGGTTLTARGVVWKTSAGVTITDNPLAEGGTSVATFTYGRSALPPGTQVFYAAYATNPAGSSLSSESSFYTLSDVPDNQPTSVVATALSKSVINVAFPAASTTGPNTKAYVVLRKIGSAPTATDVTDGVDPNSLPLKLRIITDLSKTSFNDSSLVGDTHYYYAIIPYNWDGSHTETINYKTGGGPITDDDVTFSSSSDITFTGGTTSGIDYANLQTAGTLTNSATNSASLATFQIRDGGGSADNDNVGTTLTDLTIQLGVMGYVRNIAIFDATNTNVAEVDNVSIATNSVTFNGLSLTAANDGTYSFTIRASFLRAGITDGQPIQVKITSATASASGSDFASGSAGGAQSSSTANDIDVKTSKLIFVDDPSNLPASGTLYAGFNGPLSANPNTAFTATVWAVDAFTNVDLGNTSSITITATGGPGAIAGTNVLSLTAGKKKFTNLKVTLAGSYDLEAADGNATTTDAQRTFGSQIDLTINSLGTTIARADTSICQVGTGNFWGKLPLLKFTESDPSDFSSGNNLSLVLVLPDTWEFMTPSTTPAPTPAYTAPTITFTASANISSANFVGFIGKNIAKFQYTLSGANKTDEIQIKGLYIRNVSATSSTTIVSLRGGTMAGVTDGTNLATLSVTASASADFTVSASPNQNAVTPTETNFSVSSAAIILNPEVPAGNPITGGTFTGEGIAYKFIGTPVNAYRFTFNPNSLQPGTHDVLYTYSDPTYGCISRKTKTFNVYASSIDGLQSQYCINDNSTQSLSPNPAFVPSGYTFVNYSIQFQSYAFVQGVTNNGTSLTITAPNHGLQSGSYQIYLQGGFVGVDAPFGYVYGMYPISNVTPNTFDIPVVVTGSWQGYGYFFKNPNVTNVTNLGSSLRFTAAGHGLQNGVKIFVNVNGMSIDGGATTSFYGWYTVSNVTTNTFDITVTATGAFISGSVDVFTFQISSFKPNMYSSLNSNLTAVDYYYVGFFLRQNGCSGWQQCNEFINSAEYVRINQLPVVDFSGLGSDYCKNNSTPITLTGSRTDGDFTISPNFGLTDGGDNDNTASFLPSTASLPTETTLTVKYSFTDANNCTNTISKTTIVHALPTINSGPTVDLCKGDGAIIGGSPLATGNAPFGYSWNNGPTLDNSLAANPKASPTVTTAYTVTVLDAFGCTNTGIVNVVVSDPATVNLGANPSICSGSNVSLVTSGATGGTASSATWSTPDGTGQFKDSGGATNATYGSGQANHYVPSSTDITNGRFTITLTTNDPAGPCPAASGNLIVTIKPLPPLTITSSAANLASICQSDGNININANQVNGTWSGTASSALFNTQPAAGSTQLNPLNLVPGSYGLRYDYTDPVTTCSNFTTASLTILPTIAPSITVGIACDGYFTDLTNTSSIVPSSAPTTIDSIAWDFGDQSSLPKNKYADPIPNGFSTVTKGTFQSPSHKFKSVGQFTVQYTMKTSDGCSVTGSQQLFNHEVPRAAFAWKNACFDPGSGTADVQFTGANLNGNLSAAEIQSYTWDFAATSPTPVLTYSGSTNGKKPLTTYTNTGRDSVQLIVTTVNSCRDTIQKPIFIVPSYPAITELNSYSETFDGTSGGWIDGGTNSSWQYGTPAKATINRDSSATGTGKAWVTNLVGNNNPGEQSWVLSPCFDFSLSTKPVISLDIWSDTPRRLDGAVLQYTDSANIEKDANWTVLGQVSQGINWYDQNGISSKPGNQTSVDAGWTGDATGGRYKSWVHAIFRLDDLIGKPNVKFRIAFASGAGNQEGFAFDNFFIGERSRNVLIENFTNTSAEANTTAHNTYYNNFNSASSELVKVQYHTAFPGYDTLNRVDKQMDNARTAFYGITTAPTFRIDGKSGDGPFAGWFSDLYDQRVLSPSSIRIDIATPVKSGEKVLLNASITNTTTTPLNLKDAHVFIVVVEKSITTQPWLGQSGNAQFSFVARQMLPTPAGIPIGQVLAPGATFDIPETVWSDNNLFDTGNSMVIVYVQSLLSDKEVFQAEAFDAPAEPDVITGAEPSFAELVGVYPNPSRGSFVIELPSKAKQNLPINMTDNFGRDVYADHFKKGENKKSVNTSQLAAGVYLLQILSDKGEILRRKVMIIN